MQKKTKSEEGKADKSKSKKDASATPDPKTNQDFPNYPQAPENEKIVNPSSKNEKEVSDLDNKDGEKRNYSKKNEKQDVKN